MTWRERLYRSLPFALVLLSAVGVAVTEEVWAAVIGLVGMWLLPSPIAETTNVSRETVSSDVSRETIPVPCVVMHGSAEPHVLGCEGWTSGLS